MMADVDGDGLQDVLGFGNNGVMVSLSTGSGFTAPSKWVNSYGSEKGWSTDKHPRMMADVDGDGLQDVLGFGNAGVYVSPSTGTGFAAPSIWVNSYGADKGW